MIATADDIAELHWQAGMFEGEGSVRINKPTKRNFAALLVDLANTDESIVRMFQSMWGGTVTYYPHSSHANSKPYWRWRAASNMARAFLLAMWPCLRTDKYLRRAVLGLDFQMQKLTGNKARWLKPEAKAAYRARQVEMYEQMKTLNIRGKSKEATA